MIIKRGQVSFPNTSNKNRLALTVYIQDKNNHYKKAYYSHGDQVKIGYDKICEKDHF